IGAQEEALDRQSPPSRLARGPYRRASSFDCPPTGPRAEELVQVDTTPPSSLDRSDPRKLGRYRIRQRLGGGGMGVVYLADDARGRPVAIKVIRSDYANDREFRSRFKREVEAAARVGGSFTARVLDADPDG